MGRLLLSEGVRNMPRTRHCPGYIASWSCNSSFPNPTYPPRLTNGLELGVGKKPNTRHGKKNPRHCCQRASSLRYSTNIYKYNESNNQLISIHADIQNQGSRMQKISKRKRPNSNLLSKNLLMMAVACCDWLRLA